MLTDPHFLVMFAKQLPTNDFPILSYDPDKSVDILSMLTYQFGELLQLPFQPLKPPGQIAHRLSRTVPDLPHSPTVRSRKGSDYDISLHVLVLSI